MDWIFIYDSTFCPHSVFMCFVWIWEKTAIISLYSINWLDFITETECVYCEVRTDSLDIIKRILVFKTFSSVAHISLFKTASVFHSNKNTFSIFVAYLPHVQHHNVTFIYVKLHTSRNKQNYLCAINQLQLHVRNCSVDKTRYS